MGVTKFDLPEKLPTFVIVTSDLRLRFEACVQERLDVGIASYRV